MLRLALGLGRRLGEIRSLAVPTAEAAQAYAGHCFSTSTASFAKGAADVEFDSKDVDTSFARMLMAEADAEKKKDAMTKDINKIIEWLEDATPSDDKGYDGKLKDILPSFDKSELNEFCKDIPSSTEMANMQPALKNLINDLGSIGEAGRIVDIAYKYAELLDPKAAEQSRGLSVELVLPSKESAAEVEDKKNMLVQDMLKRKRIDAKTPISWTVTVDPSILGGCIYRLGDVELDCSRKSLEDEFYASLEKEGIKRIA